jgi:hypothetical protein
LLIVCPGWPRAAVLLISASQLAEIADLYYGPCLSLLMYGKLLTVRKNSNAIKSNPFLVLFYDVPVIEDPV